MRVDRWLVGVVVTPVIVSGLFLGITRVAPLPFSAVQPAIAATQEPLIDDALLNQPIPAGRVVEHSLVSAVLNRELPYAVYLPPGADQDETRYPVLYLLHGLGASYHQWIDIGVTREADRLIVKGVIPPMVIVFPQGDDGYWMNHRPTGPRWRDYLLTELIPQVEASEPIDGRREARAIGGISAGGHGALQLVWNNPQLFAVLGAHSPGMRNEQTAFAFFGKGEEFARRDPMTLARKIARLDVDIWIDTGDQDPWRSQVETMHKTLQDRGITHTYRQATGAHDGTYWAAHLAEYLTFYGTALHHRMVLAASIPAEGPNGLNDPAVATTR